MKANISYWQRSLKHVMLMALLVCTCTMQAQFLSAPAFPGAEGFGRYTTGGRGGQVIHVTNLNDSGTGSLRAAIKTDGARIIVFDVAGIIELQSDLKIEKDNCTILGQTAPGDGICLRNYSFQVNANNVIVRYIRCRMGDTAENENDAMSASHKTGGYKQNIIIDHCSISWCVDECGSFYGNENFTLQWCILSESLRFSIHEKGSHGYGGIWGGDKAAFHHNLLAHHNSRNPRFDHGYVSEQAGILDYVNNVVYNWGGNSTYGGENKKGLEPKKFNMINNYYKPGPFTLDSTGVSNRLLNPTTKCSNCNSSDQYDIVPGKFYINGNKVNGTTVNLTTSSTSCSNIAFDSGYNFSSFASNCLSNSRYVSSDKDFGSYNTISLHSADNAFTKTVQYAGASYSRDAVDVRIASEATNGTCTYYGSKYHSPGLIDTQSDVGGWPTYSGTKQTDSDNDGIPDAWETAHGLSNSVNNATTYILDSRGYYTDLEVYANYLVQDITKAERAGATATFEEYYPLDEASTGTGEEEEEEEEIAGVFFSLTNTATSNVSVAAGNDVDLASYATITGGTALVHNGHSTENGNLISSQGIRLANSGGSYIKIELEYGLKEGDILTTTGGDGGYVATQYINSSTDNISDNTFTFTSAYIGVKTLYIMRGSSKPWMSSITIKRIGEDKVWDFSEFTEQNNEALIEYNGLNLVSSTNTSDYVSASVGFRMNGTSTATTRYIEYTPTTDGVMTVFYASNNASATDRITAISTQITIGTSIAVGEDGVLAYGYTDGSTQQSIQAELKAGTTYYIYFANGGQAIKKLIYSPGATLDNITSLTLVDGEEYTQGVNKVYEEVSYSKAISETLANKWTSLYVPFVIDIEDYAGLFDIAEIHAMNPYRDTNNDGVVNDNDDDMLIVEQITTGTTEPNTPYLIRAKEAGTIVITPKDKKTYAATNGQKVFNTSKATYTFTGLNSSVTATPDNDYYYMSAGTISHRVTGSTIVKPNRWYMTVSNASAGAKPSFSIAVIGEEDDVTGVKTVKSVTSATSNDIYTLDGRKVSGNKMPAGLYISNRKKIIVR